MYFIHIYHILHEFCYFIQIPQENVTDLFAYKGSKTKELPINTMQNSFQKIPFPRILRIK